MDEYTCYPDGSQEPLNQDKDTYIVSVLCVEDAPYKAYFWDTSYKCKNYNEAIKFANVEFKQYKKDPRVSVFSMCVTTPEGRVV